MSGRSVLDELELVVEERWQRFPSRACQPDDWSDSRTLRESEKWRKTSNIAETSIKSVKK